MKKVGKSKNMIWMAIAAIMLVMQLNVLAQDSYKVAEDSKMTIKGTSTIHDWETKVTEINGGGMFAIDEKALGSVNNFQLSVPVKSLDSGKKGMDSKIYEALKADKSPKIEFKFMDSNQITPGKIVVNGKMTVAGKTKNVQLTSDYKLDNGKIIVSGNHSMKMTEFEVDPPSAMLGTVKAGDNIQIEYNLVLVNENNQLKTSK